MKEIYINADDYNSDSIKTIQGNNNAEEYKIYLQYDNEKIDLTGKTVNLAFLRVGSTDGDIIENLNVTNPKEGEITLKITNKISKRNGTYSCQLAILGEGDFLEHTATFTLTVENNIFSDITKAIADSKDFTYLENILDKASKLSEKLKENTATATNANSNLESNITEAKAANTNLLAVNQEATTKNTELQASLEKTKEFINGLDGSQNIPQIRMDVTELQNGLKSNQALAYTGSSISADNTLEGRTEGMKIKGKTMYKKKDGTYTDTWEEGVTLESFGETEGNKISILSHGKNLLKPPLEEMSLPLSDNSPKVTITTDGKYILDGGSTITGGRHSFKKLLPPLLLKKGVKYKISGNDSSNTILFINRFSDDSPLFNNKVEAYTPNEDTKVYFGINFSVTTYNNQVIKPQLEEGIIATSYEPYREDKKDILIKEPLRGFDENTCDIMYEDNGQVKVDRKLSEYTFTGDENWQPSSELQDELICFYISFPLTTATTPILCNNFIQKPTMEKGIECITNNGGGNSTVRIKINKSKLTTPDINGFKAWLKANPTTIVYQLATPVIEVVENCVDIDLDTFQDKTYFNILNSLPGTLDFKVPSNIASIVQSNSKAINELYNLIDTLVLPNILQNTTDIEMLKLEKLK